MLGLNETDDVDPSLVPLHSASCTYRIALGPRAGQKVLTLKTAEPQDWSIPSDRCVSHSGFSLHVNTYCAPTNRGKLKKLCRYDAQRSTSVAIGRKPIATITRLALVNERVKINHDGNVVLKLKSVYRDGTTHLVMAPLEFMQKLAALIPQPRLNLTRYRDVLAPNEKLRSQIILRPPEDSTDEDVKDTEAMACTGIRKQYMPWARLLKRVFDIDIEQCPHCDGQLKIIAAVEDPAIIVKILKHLGLPTRAPPRKPARYRSIYDSS